MAPKIRWWYQASFTLEDVGGTGRRDSMYPGGRAA